MIARRLSRIAAPKILLVRNDGLGDFLLTLPLAAALKAGLPGARVFALVNRHLSDLIPLLPDLEGAVLDDGVLLKRHRGLLPPEQKREKRAALLEEIRAHKFDLAVLPYSEAGSAALIHQAGIPLRAGSLRRPYFWRFNLFNLASRRGSHQAEYELNLTYLRTLGLPGGYVAPALDLSGAPAGPYVVLHPYKRNATALSWPMAEFQRLAGTFMEWGLEVVVVGDVMDGPVLKSAFGGGETGGGQTGGRQAGRGPRLEVGLSLSALAERIAGARLFVGNSSGPLHLAGLLGTPHVGLFPQSRVGSPGRWRTLPVAGAPREAAVYLLSPDFPKNCVGCEMERCPHFNCVAAITQQQVRAAARAWGLGPGQASAGAARGAGGA